MSTALGSSNYGATRSERLRFRLCLDKARIEAHGDDIRTVLGGDPPETVEGDTLRMTYEVGLHYFGNVETRLAAINRLLTIPDLINGVSLEELNYGQSVLVGVV